MQAVVGTFANINNPDVIEVGWKLCIPSRGDVLREN
jgi:hypothetical protein